MFIGFLFLKRMDCEFVIAKVMSELEQGIVNLDQLFMLKRELMKLETLDQLRTLKEELLKIEEGADERTVTITGFNGISEATVVSDESNEEEAEEIDLLEGAAERLAELVEK